MKNFYILDIMEDHEDIFDNVCVDVTRMREFVVDQLVVASYYGLDGTRWAIIDKINWRRYIFGFVSKEEATLFLQKIYEYSLLYL